MKRTIFLLILLLSVSCNESKKQETNEQNGIKETKSEVLKDDILKVKLEFKATQDDKFELYYSENESSANFSPNDRLAQYVKASNEFQNVEFKLPKKVFPSNFRIDLGDNPIMNESPVEIKSITLEWNGHLIVIDNSLLSSFFQPNAYLQPNEMGYSRTVIDGKYDPFLLAKPVLIKKMEIEL